ncbi:hypothetical protein [uncultured Treponema sp.]|nr:hypothetical protein [uncultured Treponema sp.]
MTNRFVIIQLDWIILCGFPASSAEMTLGYVRQDTESENLF